MLGALTGLELVEGLPLAALMAFCPLVAAVILTGREHGAEGVKRLLTRAIDWERIRNPGWYLPALLVRPGAAALSYWVLRASGAPLPAPRLSLIAALGLFLALFPAAVGEEVGWSGYALDRLQEGRTALASALLLGLIWAAWHLVPLLQAHRPAEWIAWWGLLTVANRVLIVWLYHNTGRSVFAASLYHTTDNVSWLMFPNLGSHFDPRTTGLIVAGVAIVATLVWGPRTLTRNRGA